MSSGDGRDAGPVLALEPLSTTWPSNYRHLQPPPGLGQADTVPRRLCLGDSTQEALPRSTPFLGDSTQETLPRSAHYPGDSAQEHTVPRSRLLLGDSSEERARVF